MSYGRNFEFRSTPKGAERAARYFLDETSAVPIGAPVVVDTSADADAVGRLPVVLADEGAAPPAPGMGGILVYEHIQYIDVDPFLTTYSDLSTAPADAPVQVVNGTAVKVALKNTTDTTFLTRTGYPHARIMVAGVSIATPTVAVGDYLTPGAGDDTDGYWKEGNSNGSDGWLIVTAVDTSAGLVEARLTF